MDKLLLTYNEPLLLTFSSEEKESKVKSVFSKIGQVFYRITVGTCAVLSSLCLIDMIDSPLTDGVMTGIYAVADYFAPDLELFDNNTRLGFVSKIMNSDFRYMGECQGVQHIIESCQPQCQDGDIIYITSGAGRIVAPADCLVKSIDNVAEITYVSMSIGDDMIVAIESDIPMGVSVGQYVSRGSLIGSFAGSHKVKMTFYRKGEKVADPIKDKDINWLADES